MPLPALLCLQKGADEREEVCSHLFRNVMPHVLLPRHAGVGEGAVPTTEDRFVAECGVGHAPAEEGWEMAKRMVLSPQRSEPGCFASEAPSKHPAGVAPGRRVEGVGVCVEPGGMEGR